MQTMRGKLKNQIKSFHFISCRHENQCEKIIIIKYIFHNRIRKQTQGKIIKFDNNNNNNKNYLNFSQKNC
jgi:hypothetical protein